MFKIENIIRQRRLRWAGHLSRMPDTRIPHKIAFSELKVGKRPQCKPKKRWADILKEDIQLMGLDVKTWRTVAADRRTWGSKVQDAIHGAHEAQLSAATEKRANRHEEEEKWDWKCPLCNFVRHGRRGRQYVQSHITQCHRDEAQAQQLTSLTCTHCNYTCATKSGLTSHLRHKHPGEPPPGLRPQKLLPAQTAPPTTPVPSLLAPAHPAPSAPTPAPAAPPTPANLSGFTCERCGRVCASRAGLISHSRGKSCRGQSLERGGNARTTNA
ncbi:uncharacterized protein LOC103514725 isoform X1 [Diaphorina citri]|uniref:Uncharacterized protein LOC103514725 isoform X1 n=1 Tax=Diaphorina citri TaxID=121845 RepID=A0A1S4EI75_DIACI|nr:uncharacterized protein LOC103514725 isoform X2 [Diaphorina citri]XP_017301829.1 uncharacterized protein LOC103514725 isoform X1 [Diaphorina citri]